MLKSDKQIKPVSFVHCFKTSTHQWHPHSIVFWHILGSSVFYSTFL